MKKKIGIVLTIISVGLLLVSVVMPHAEPPEPSYQGKPLSAWLDDYIILSSGRPGEDEQIRRSNEQIDNVVRQIGTNAIPTLLTLLTVTDPTSRKLADFAGEHGLYNDFGPKSTRAIARNIEAAMAFRALGPEAKELTPCLIRLYDQHEEFREFLAPALGAIGPSASNAVPSLLEAVTNAKPTQAPWNALQALGEIHAEPDKVVPVLTGLLKSPNPSVRKRTAIALGAFGLEAKPAVPALVLLLSETNVFVQRAVAKAIKQIDPDAVKNAGVP